MSLWAVLEVAIGLAFVYLLLALFATAMQELVATWFRLRRDYLWKALSDALGGAGNELFEKVLTHPLISPGVAPVAGSSSSARKENAPSYIPARNFSIAVLDFLRKFNANQTAGDIKKAIAGLPEGAVRTSLEALYADADENLEKFKQRLEIWFDDAMDRLTGVYKRWVQYFAFGFGAVAAVLFNVDSINVAKTLWLDHNMRAAMTAAAESYVKNNPAPAPNAGNQPRDARSGSAGASPTSPCQPRPPAATSSGAPGVTDATKDFEEARRCAELLKAQIEQLPLPLGWAGVPAQQRPEWQNYDDLQRFQAYVVYALLALPGWLITALAVSLGAPFWFDTLKTLINIRGAGPKPERSPATRANDHFASGQVAVAPSGDATGQRPPQAFAKLGVTESIRDLLSVRAERLSEAGERGAAPAASVIVVPPTMVPPDDRRRR